MTPAPMAKDVFDDLGNTVAEASGSGSVTYAYNPFNQLASVTTAGGTTTYSYNALNQRAHDVAGTGGGRSPVLA